MFCLCSGNPVIFMWVEVLRVKSYDDPLIRRTLFKGMRHNLVSTDADGVTRWKIYSLQHLGESK